MRPSPLAPPLLLFTALAALAAAGPGTAAAQGAVDPTAPPPSVAAPVEPIPAPAPPATAPGAPPPVGVAPVPTVVSEPIATPAPAAPVGRPTPLYRKHWFWGLTGLLVLTAGIILFVSLRPTGPARPDTTLGDMRAF